MGNFFQRVNAVKMRPGEKIFWLAFTGAAYILSIVFTAELGYNQTPVMAWVGCGLGVPTIALVLWLATRERPPYGT